MLPEPYRQRENSYFCRFTFGQFFTLLVIEIFSLFFLFYLGARYGRELLGIEPPAVSTLPPAGTPLLQTTNPEAVATMHDPEIQALAKEILEQAPSPDLKQRVAEMLEKGGEVKKEGGQDGALKEDLPDGAVKDRAVKNQASPQVAVTKPVTPPQAEIEEKTEAPRRPSVPPPVIQTNPFGGSYSIQVGAYPNVDEAYSKVDDWKNRGYPAFLVSADIPEKGRWYRVRLGGFNTKEEAQTYLDELATHENHPDAFIAPNE